MGVINTMDDINIEKRLAAVKERIRAAAEKCGRDPAEITLIAVTKTYPVSAMNTAIKAGITDVGENKPQEIRDKFDSVLPVRWHLIGHLQSNKIKYVIDRCDLIHSVDSIKLMDEIENKAKAHDRDIDILIQVNISGEESKSGVSPDGLEAMLRHAAALSRVHVKGLMTIAPKAEYGDADVCFADMKKLFDTVSEKSFPNVEMRELSMGMSGDFETAIKHGATMLRIGSAIFGARNYNV